MLFQLPFSSPDAQTLHMHTQIKVKASAATGFQNKTFFLFLISYLQSCLLGDPYSQAPSQIQLLSPVQHHFKSLQVHLEKLFM